MADIHFYLKKAEKSTGESLIFLQWKYNGRTLRYSFGQTINPNNWSFTKERVKDKHTTTKNGDILLNDLLEKLIDICKESYNKFIGKGIPNPETIKEELRNFVEQRVKEKEHLTFLQLLEKFMNNGFLHEGRSKSRHTTKTYKTVYNHIRGFEKKKRFKVTYEFINGTFAKEYKDYLTAKGMNHNTITKHFKSIKAVMNMAYLSEYTKNLAFKRKDFSFSYQETSAVYLTDEEIQELYLYDFSGHKKLERTRDLFILGCVVGLRFSDFSKLTANNIRNIEGKNYFHILTQKTKEIVLIPCHPIALEVLTKYSNNLPRSVSNQKFNEYIKQACEKAGLKETGRLISEPEKELYKCIGSHTCRRSFATNLYLNGASIYDIMKVTGHRTEKAFKTYIKVSKIDAAKRILGYYKNTDLRVAM